MSDHDLWFFRVEDILHAIDRIERVTGSIDLHVFQDSENDQDILIRRFQIIGEAARKIPAHVKEKYPNVPWQKMIGLRNFVVHEYHKVDYRLLWNTAVQELPKVRDLLNAIKRPDIP